MRRYEDEGLDGLVDQRIGQVSARHVPVDQVLKVQDLYRNRYAGFTAKHFHEKLQEVNRIARSYTRTKRVFRGHTAFLQRPQVGLLICVGIFDPGPLYSLKRLLRLLG